MSVKITYNLTKEIDVNGEYKVSVVVISAEGITKKIFVYADDVPLYTALPNDLSIYPEDEPESPGGRYRLDNASVTVDNISHAQAEADAFEERIDRLAQEYSEEGGSFPGTTQVTVEY